MTEYTETKKVAIDTANRLKAFSLVEVITVLVISSMVVILMIGIYTRTRNAAASVNRKLTENELPMEILQRIAEDIDRLAAPGFDTTIRIRNKLDAGFNICQLTIENKIYNKENKAETFERIIWQTHLDPAEYGLSLYRLHGGLNLEGNVDFEFSDIARENDDLFIRLCTEITYFKIQVPSGEDYQTQWTSTTLPKALTVSISFAEPFENISGDLEVFEDQMITRTIAVDRTRMMTYKFVPKDFSEYDPNNIDQTLLDSDDTTDTTDKDQEKDDENEDRK